MLTHVGLFEGSGIPSYIAECCGMKAVAWCESDLCCQYCLAKLFPGAIGFSDVRTADWSNIPQPVTLLTAGVPCQPVSVAGKQKGREDERWLWPDTIRAIESIRPSWIVLENPPAIRLHGLERIAADLEGIGYDLIPKGRDGRFTPLCVGAWAVGAPHKRDRVWIVGHTRRQFESSVQLADADQAGRKERLRVGNHDATELTPVIRSRWPSRPGEPQHDWEAPRLIECGVGDATNELARRLRSRTNKALLRMAGNGWVPQIASIIYTWIVEVENARPNL